MSYIITKDTMSKGFLVFLINFVLFFSGLALNNLRYCNPIVALWPCFSCVWEGSFIFISLTTIMNTV